ncbi:BlaI/MecI/CopY family transcriptional regulator [Candidatus Sumerlaeota bacterium]|nr:BlaI/MecI/CopY family transcriptional regulator [Candidatus Sumerlaeota bacterium]
MRVLWSHGTLKPAEIEELFPRPVGNGAVRSVLLILLEKGHVDRRKVGKAFYYEAKTSPDSEFKNWARRFADVFCGGSPKALIAQLIKSEKLSAEDIRELEKVASSDPASAEKAGEHA